MNLEDTILATGPDTRVMVVSTPASKSGIDPFARLVVEHARRGVPVVLVSLSKTGPELGRELLHALADLPPGVSTLGSAQFLRLAQAGALLESLDVEILELSQLAERVNTLQQRAGDPDWPTGLVAIDLRRSLETPGHAAPFEPTAMTALLVASTAAGWTAILGVDAPRLPSGEGVQHE